MAWSSHQKSTWEGPMSEVEKRLQTCAALQVQLEASLPSLHSTHRRIDSLEHRTARLQQILQNQEEAVQEARLATAHALQWKEGVLLSDQAIAQQCIVLNVGGQRLETTADTLLRSQSLLARMVQDLPTTGAPGEPRVIFIDRSPAQFQVLLDFFRTGDCPEWRRLIKGAWPEGTTASLLQGADYDRFILLKADIVFFEVGSLLKLAEEQLLRHQQQPQPQADSSGGTVTFVRRQNLHSPRP
jgi:hypothetical protein